MPRFIRFVYTSELASCIRVINFNLMVYWGDQLLVAYLDEAQFSCQMVK